MANISIWDLDYYYSKDKKNCFNPDAMKISSYHKQMGDKVNFVLTKYDIYRPYDLYYILKENNKTPNPPLDLAVAGKIRWCGKAYKGKKNWTMPPLMVMARPDYLLYPNHNTKEERSEQVRLLDESQRVLTRCQDWHNTYKNKKVYITDKNLWNANVIQLTKALMNLKDIKNISFFEPIEIKKLITDEEIRNLFLNLNFCYQAEFKWEPLRMEEKDTIEEYCNYIKQCIDFLSILKQKKNRFNVGVLKILIPKTDNKSLVELYKQLLDIIIIAKEKKIRVEIESSNWRDNPYYFIYNEISNWTKTRITRSWLEYITARYGKVYNFHYMVEYWSHPERWNPIFRDILRQTWINPQFAVKKWGHRKITATSIPWLIWEKEFKYGL